MESDLHVDKDVGERQVILDALKDWVIQEGVANKRRVLLLPWRPHSVAAPAIWSYVLAGLIGSGHPNNSGVGVVPLLVSAPELCKRGDGEILSFLADCALIPSGNDAHRIVFYEHLRRGQILIILTGLTDVDIPPGGTNDARAVMLEAGDLSGPLAKLVSHAPNIVTVARGSSGPSSPGEPEAYYPYKQTLEQAPFNFEAEWLIKGEAEDRVMYPTMESQRKALFAPEGDAFTQLLPLRPLATEEVPVRELAVCRFLQPDSNSIGGVTHSANAEDKEAALPLPMLEIVCSEASATGEAEGGATWHTSNFREWVAGKQGPNLVLLDSVDRYAEGGTGKTTQLLSIMLSSYVERCPALYATLNSLRAVPAPSSSNAKQEDLLARMLRYHNLNNDKALRPHLEASGVTLLLDGLNEAPATADEGWLLAMLLGSLTNPIEGVKVLMASRRSEWEKQGPADGVAYKSVASQLHEQLIENEQLSGDRLPVKYLVAMPPTEDAASAYLESANPTMARAIAQFTMGDLLTHPFSLGLLCTLRNARYRHQRVTVVWQLVDLLVEQQIKDGLAGHGSPEGGWLFEEDQGLAYLRALALAMIEQGSPLSHERAIEAVLEVVRPKSPTPTTGYKRSPKRQGSLRSIEHHDKLWQVAAHALLEQLCSACVLLVRDPDKSLRFLHSNITTALASACLRGLKSSDHRHYQLAHGLLTEAWWLTPDASAALAMEYARIGTSLDKLPPNPPDLKRYYFSYLPERKLSTYLANLLDESAEGGPSSDEQMAQVLRLCAGRLPTVAPHSYLSWIDGLFTRGKVEEATGVLLAGNEAMLLHAYKEDYLLKWLNRSLNTTGQSARVQKDGALLLGKAAYILAKSNPRWLKWRLTRILATENSELYMRTLPALIAIAETRKSRADRKWLKAKLRVVGTHRRYATPQDMQRLAHLTRLLGTEKPDATQVAQQAEQTTAQVQQSDASCTDAFLDGAFSIRPTAVVADEVVSALILCASREPHLLLDRLQNALSPLDTRECRIGARILRIAGETLAACEVCGTRKLIENVMSADPRNGNWVLASAGAVSSLASDMARTEEQQGQLLGWLEALVQTDQAPAGDAFRAVRAAAPHLWQQSGDQFIDWVVRHIRSSGNDRAIVSGAVLSVAASLPRGQLWRVVAAITN